MDTGAAFADSAPVFNETPDPTMHTAPARHDTKAWKAQVWIAFGSAGTSPSSRGGSPVVT